MPGDSTAADRALREPRRLARPDPARSPPRLQARGRPFLGRAAAGPGRGARGPRAASLLAVVLSTLAQGCGGCEEATPRPWETPAGEAGGSPLFLAGSGGGPLARLGDPSRRRTEPGPEPGASAEPDALPPIPAGGPWVRCYGDFRPSGEPARDVVRLGTLCGPSTGMERVEGAAASGEVGPGAPARFSLEGRAGECFRIFTVASGVGQGRELDVDVVVRSSRGSAVAADHGEGGWPIVQPDRPFCTTVDDAFTVEIASPRGPARYAAESWRLPPRRADVDVGRKER